MALAPDYSNVSLAMLQVGRSRVSLHIIIVTASLIYLICLSIGLLREEQEFVGLDFCLLLYCTFAVRVVTLLNYLQLAKYDETQQNQVLYGCGGIRKSIQGRGHTLRTQVGRWRNH